MISNQGNFRANSMFTTNKFAIACILNLKIDLFWNDHDITLTRIDWRYLLISPIFMMIE